MAKTADTKTERKNISQPKNVWPEFQAAAAAEGISLSAWLGACGIANLSKEAAARCGERPPASRPLEYWVCECGKRNKLTGHSKNRCPGCKVYKPESNV
tara:strand:+ start:167 stop:463 length:297 start_codon:yes stop_codon:yes gene_type:complete